MNHAVKAILGENYLEHNTSRSPVRRLRQALTQITEDNLGTIVTTARQPIGPRGGIVHLRRTVPVTTSTGVKVTRYQEPMPMINGVPKKIYEQAERNVKATVKPVDYKKLDAAKRRAKRR